ncbi:hypothetical protein [Vibrio injensis]|uniref:hypothetical protein n=1 Tax=Vibrio injensis TaxID=1307414 RepID=UPI0009335447|nr:hypothetical protein [Vibrio injensis]
MTDRDSSNLHQQAKDPQHQMLMLMVEMRSELGAIRELVTNQGKHTNQRIDDLKAALDARMKAQEKDIDDLNTALSNVNLKSASTGGLAGGLAAVAVELAKLMMKGG